MTTKRAIEEFDRALNEGCTEEEAARRADRMVGYEEDERRADEIEEEARERVNRGVYRLDPVTGELIGPGGPFDSPGDCRVEGPE